MSFQRQLESNHIQISGAPHVTADIASGILHSHWLSSSGISIVLPGQRELTAFSHEAVTNSVYELIIAQRGSIYDHLLHNEGELATRNENAVNNVLRNNADSANEILNSITKNQDYPSMRGVFHILTRDIKLSSLRSLYANGDALSYLINGIKQSDCATQEAVYFLPNGYGTAHAKIAFVLLSLGILHAQEPQARSISGFIYAQWLQSCIMAPTL